MKCECGAEISTGAKFCRKCGKLVSEFNHLDGGPQFPESFRWGPQFGRGAKFGEKCGACGAQLYPGAHFCGQCGNPIVIYVDPVAPSRCSKCGKSFLGIGSLCDSCKRAETHDGSWVGTIKEKTEPVRKWADSKVTDKKRAKQLVIVALVVGLCIAFAGLAGKITMGRLSANMRNAEIFSGMDSELGGVLNRSAGNAITKLIVSMIKNDSSGFVSTINQLTNIAGSMAGDPYGMNGLGSMLFGSFAQEAFAETRAQLIQEAGAYWPLLQAMAYYRELLTIGLIIAFAAAILWFLLDGKFNDVMASNMIPVLYVGAGWIVLVIILTILGTHALS